MIPGGRSFLIFPLGIMENSDMSSTGRDFKVGHLVFKKSLNLLLVTDPPGLGIMQAQVFSPRRFIGDGELRSPEPPWIGIEDIFDLRERNVFDPRTIRSLIRPTIRRVPSSSMVARSPLWVQPRSSMVWAVRSGSFKISMQTFCPRRRLLHSPSQRHDSPQRSQSTPAKDQCQRQISFEVIDGSFDFAF